MVLKLAACQLLLEITAYIRETYKAVPKVGRGKDRQRQRQRQRQTYIQTDRHQRKLIDAARDKDRKKEKIKSNHYLQIGKGNKHVRLGDGGTAAVSAAARRWSTATGQSHHSVDQGKNFC